MGGPLPKWILILRLGALAAGLLPFTPPAGAQPRPLGQDLYHTPVLQAAADRDLEILLEAEEGAAQVLTAHLLWRSSPGPFRTVEMEPAAGGWAGIIPAAEVQPPVLEYALSVLLADGREITYPAANALLFPQMVTVIPGEPVRSGGPCFVVLYPHEGEILYQPPVKIALSIFDPDSLYDPSTLEVFLDGAAIQPRQSSPSYLFLEFPKLKPGKHNLVLRSRDYQGRTHADFRFSFQSASPRAGLASAAPRWSYTGEAGQENFAGQDETVLRSDLRLEGNWRRWDYGARLYVTNEESPARQPQNRFLATVRRPGLYLKAGDAAPAFGDLVLSGKRVRGVEAGAGWGNFHLAGVAGEITRKVEGSSYRRMLWGLRPYWATASGARLGFSFLKAKDDQGSVAQAAGSPQDNVVAGLDAAVPLFGYKLQWTLSAALSLTALDIRGGPATKEALEEAEVEVPIDPEVYEPLIVINESLSPPNPLGLASLAWVSALRLDHFGHLLTVDYRSVGPAYRSLGNPYQQNDVAGWNLSDQFSLWRRRVFVTLGFSRTQDNLKRDKPATTTTTGAWATLAWQPRAPAPRLVLSLNQTWGANDLDAIDTLATAGNDTLYFDPRRREDANTVNASLTQGLHWLGREHTLSFSLSRSQFQDRLEDRPPGYPSYNSLMDNYGAAWRTDMSRALNLTLNYTYYSSQSAGSPSSYHQYGARLQSRLRPRRLSLTGAVARRNGEAAVDRWQGDIWADWEFLPKHSLRAAATHFFNDASPDEGVYRLYYQKRF